jgi:hypothetical protein
LNFPVSRATSRFIRRKGHPSQQGVILRTTQSVAARLRSVVFVFYPREILFAAKLPCAARQFYQRSIFA